MNKEDLLFEYKDAINSYYNSKASLSALVERWLNGEAKYSSSELQFIINNKMKKIDELKKLADTYLTEYNKISQIEANKNNAVYHYNLNDDDEAMKQRRLNEIKNAILNNQIDIEQAEILKNKINNTKTEDYKKAASM